MRLTDDQIQAIRQSAASNRACACPAPGSTTAHAAGDLDLMLELPAPVDNPPSWLRSWPHASHAP
ncbi:MAG: hypothetical protein V4446_07150 [Pseudomonadota bacterium]